MGKTDNLTEKIREYTNGRMAECVMEASGANAAIRATLDIASHAGRIVLTGWPKQETPLPTDMITKKELDVRGARTSAGELSTLTTRTGTPREIPTLSMLPG